MDLIFDVLGTFVGSATLDTVIFNVHFVYAWLYKRLNVFLPLLLVIILLAVFIAYVERTGVGLR